MFQTAARTAPHTSTARTGCARHNRITSAVSPSPHALGATTLFVWRLELRDVIQTDDSEWRMLLIFYFYAFIHIFELEGSHLKKTDTTKCDFSYYFVSIFS